MRPEVGQDSQNGSMESPGQIYEELLKCGITAQNTATDHGNAKLMRFPALLADVENSVSVEI